MASIFDKEIESFKRILAEYGYTNDNFELTTQQDPYPPHGAVGPITGHLTVQHRETGVEYTYKIGHLQAPAVVQFKNHLKTNAFTA